MNKELVVLNISPYADRLMDFWCPYAHYHNQENGENEPFFFMCMRNSVRDIGFSCSVKTFDEIDKSKTWFINLVISGGLPTEDRTIFHCFPQEWISELVNGNAYLIINNENEYNSFPFLFHSYKEIEKFQKIPKKKIILLTAAAEIHKIHKKFCIDHNIQEKVKIIYSPHMNVVFGDNDVKYLSENYIGVEKTKKYNILNREFRWHRPFFVSLLAKYELLDLGHVSLGLSSRRQDEINSFGSMHSYLQHNLKEIQRNHSSIIHSSLFREISDGIDLIHDKIPLCLDKNEFNTNYVSYSDIPLEYMRSSYFHITSCTYFFGFEEQSTGWHEKEWKPILVKQPFLMLGRPGMLKLMKRFGFMTFSKWFDESYDDIADDWLRLEAIAKETKRLSEIPNHEWDLILDDMQNVLEVNYELLRTKRWELFFFGSDLKSLISYL